MGLFIIHENVYTHFRTVQPFLDEGKKTQLTHDDFSLIILS